MQPRSFRIWYGSGMTYDGVTLEDWRRAPSEDVQFVTVFFQETYRIWRDKRWNIEHYCRQHHGTDYYWMMAEGVIGSANAPEVPTDLPDGVIKRGKYMIDEGWWTLYNTAQDVRVP
jgi:hypothetical protein